MRGCLRAARIRATSVIVFLFMLSGAVVSAQQATPTQAPQPVFRGQVDLVTVDVRAVDQDGKPVAGLTKDDFVVTLDGQRRPVMVLDYQVFGHTSASVQSAGPVSSTSNESAPAASVSRGGRVLLLVIDDLSAQPLQMKGLLVSAERMLATLDPSDMVGIMTTSGFGPVISPTRDRAQILAVLRNKGLVGRADPRLTSPFVTVNEAFDIARSGGDRTTLGRVQARECGSPSGSGRGGGGPCPDKVVSTAQMIADVTEQTTAQQVAAFAQAIRILRDAPFPRTIIALTGGLGLYPGAVSPLDAVSLAAAEANVDFHALIAVDDMDLGIDTSPARTHARLAENDFVIGGMQSLALAAGGDAVRVIGQADRFYTRILAESSGVYRLGVEAPSNVKPLRYLSVKVSVKRSGVHVMTNAHAVQPAVEAGAPPLADLLKQRVEQGGIAFGVPVTVTTSRRLGTMPDEVQIVINVRVPASTPGPVSELFAVLDQTGHVVQSGRSEFPATPEDAYRLTFAVPVAAGAYSLRVAVGDAHGDVGSVDEPVEARLTRVGRLAASDLLVTTPSANGPHLLAFDTLPPHAQNFQVALELYQDSEDRSPLTVRLSVARADGTAPIATTEIAPIVRDGRLVASATLPVATMPAGDYRVSATVVSGGQILGSVSTRVRKRE